MRLVLGVLLCGGAAGIRLPPQSRPWRLFGAPRPSLKPFRSPAATVPLPMERTADGVWATALPEVAAPPSQVEAEAWPAPKAGPFKIMIGGRVLNAVGFAYMIVSFGVAASMYALLVPGWIVGRFAHPEKMTLVDYTVRLWAWLAMSIMGYRATVEGAEHLPPGDEPVMVVPNHTSFLDILTLSAFVPRNLKYISKVEILRLPFVGWAMRMAQHIAIRRSSRSSQIRTLREAVSSLKAGNSLVTFAEGTRSKDGRLARFKKGPFTMAKRAGVRVVPVSIRGLHRWMPPSAIMPLATPRGVVVRIHPPVRTDGRGEDEILEETYAAVASGLPEDQQPVQRPRTPATA